MEGIGKHVKVFNFIFLEGYKLILNVSLQSMIEFPTIFTWVTQPASLLKGKPNQKIPLTLISLFVAICLTNLSSFSCLYLLSSFSDQGVMVNLWLRNFSLFDSFFLGLIYDALFLGVVADIWDHWSPWDMVP